MREAGRHRPLAWRLDVARGELTSVPLSAEGAGLLRPLRHHQQFSGPLRLPVSGSAAAHLYFGQDGTVQWLDAGQGTLHEVFGRHHERRRARRG